MKIVVLAGGTSTERDVSIVSGTGICNGLRAKGHQAILVDVFCGAETVDWADPFPREYDVEAASAYIKSFNPHIEQLKKMRKDFFGPNVLELCKKADFVFLGLHGANGEDGRIQAAFDLMGIKYTGTGYLSSAMAKGVTKWMFQMKGVPVPGGVTMKRHTRKEDLAELGLAFPVVVKTCCGGSSIGVYIVKDQEEYMKALDAAFVYEEEVVVEEFIQGTEYTVAVVDGREIQVAILAGQALPSIEIIPKEGFYDYENKYKPGAVKETCPAPISSELTRRLQDYAVQGYRALGLESYARLDFIVTDDEKIYCLEANTLPGMTPTSLIPQEAAVLGMDYPTLCEELIRVSEKKYK